MDKYLSIKNGQQAAEEQAVRIMKIMISQNTSFYLFDNKDFKELFEKAYPNLKV